MVPGEARLWVGHAGERPAARSWPPWQTSSNVGATFETIDLPKSSLVRAFFVGPCLLRLPTIAALQAASRQVNARGPPGRCRARQAPNFSSANKHAVILPASMGYDTNTWHKQFSSKWCATFGGHSLAGVHHSRLCTNGVPECWIGRATRKKCANRTQQRDLPDGLRICCVQVLPSPLGHKSCCAADAPSKSIRTAS